MQDLALILVSAGVVTVLFRKIRQPVVLGYILAGFLVGPNTQWIPTITDQPSVQTWAEIGVIFLLFALGLEFSFKKLAKVGGTASVTAVIEVIGMTVLGFLVGHLFGWSKMDSLFLGGALAISSTTIIIRAFEETRVKGRGFANLVFGVLVIEDLVAIVLLVLLSTVAVSNQFDGTELFASVLKLAFFLIVWFLVGIFFLPPWLKKMKRHSDDETFLIMSLGLCFLMVVLSTKVGFSSALGAFVMGSLLAETTEAERIEHLVKPVKDLFAAIFFVSVGMLIDPKIIFEYALPISIITIVTIFGKFFSTLLGALIAGRSLKHSVQAGMSLAQIGEFSFIIAGLGLSLKVTSDFLYPVTVGVSALTTFSTPYMIRSADSVYRWIDKSLPESVRQALLKYSVSTGRVARNEDWHRFFKKSMIHILVNSVLITAIFLLLSRFLPRVLGDYLSESQWVDGLGLTIATVTSAPFFWALLMNRGNKDELSRLWNQHETRRLMITLATLRAGIGITLFGVLAAQFINVEMAAGIAVLLTVLLLTVFSKYLKMIYRWIENRFVENLSERENENAKNHPLLAPWDAHISKLEVSPDSDCVDKTLKELRIRENFGITVALIERGQKIITAPTRNEKLWPHDRVAVIGTDEQIQKLKDFLSPAVAEPMLQPTNYVLLPITISARMSFCKKPIRDSGIRELTSGLVVGLEREGRRMLNPDSNVVIEEGDLLWIVGDRDQLKKMAH